MTETRTTTAKALPDGPPVAGLRPRFLVDGSDYESLAELIRTCHEYDAIPWLPSADNLRLDMRHDGVDAARDVVVVSLDDLVVALTAVHRQVRDGVPVYEVWGKVRPDLRRRGIGRWLFDWSLARASQRAAQEDPEGPVTLGAHAGDREAGARALYDRAGLVPVRHFLLMRNDRLRDVEPAPLPPGLEIRPVTREQYHAIYDAGNEAFRDHWGSHEHGEEDFHQTFNQPDTNTDLWAVGWDGEQVAGVVEGWIWSEENRRLGLQRGWLEKISVRRPWRRRGLARALTAAAMIKLRDAGVAEAALGVDAENPSGALALYESLGFSVFRRSIAYRRPLER